MTSVEYEDPLYGTVKFPEEFTRIIEYPAIQRLNAVHQNGAAFLTNPDMDTSRFEHSLGVAFLCSRLGASDEEVVAALVHDVGHTAFSHVVDHVFERTEQDFHEDEVGRIVTRYDLDEHLERAGFDAETVLDMDGFPILEQPLPGICADRLDYQLRDVYKYGLIGRDTVEDILAGITLEAGRPVATDRHTARTLVDVSLLLQRQVFFHDRHEAANLVLADLLETALEREVLTVDDLFQTDQAVLDTLRTDPEFAEPLDALGREFSIHRDPVQPTVSISRKRRSMNPHVAGTGQRISELDSTVEHKLTQFRDSVPAEQTYALDIVE